MWLLSQHDADEGCISLPADTKGRCLNVLGLVASAAAGSAFGLTAHALLASVGSASASGPRHLAEILTQTSGLIENTDSGPDDQDGTSKGGSLSAAQLSELLRLCAAMAPRRSGKAVTARAGSVRASLLLELHRLSRSAQVGDENGWLAWYAAVLVLWSADAVLYAAVIAAVAREAELLLSNDSQAAGVGLGIIDRSVKLLATAGIVLIATSDESAKPGAVNGVVTVCDQLLLSLHRFDPSDRPARTAEATATVAAIGTLLMRLATASPEGMRAAVASASSECRSRLQASMKEAVSSSSAATGGRGSSSTADAAAGAASAAGGSRGSQSAAQASAQDEKAARRAARKEAREARKRQGGGSGIAGPRGLTKPRS
jgi:hypothetical protein